MSEKNTGSNLAVRGFLGLWMLLISGYTSAFSFHAAYDVLFDGYDYLGDGSANFEIGAARLSGLGNRIAFAGVVRTWGGYVSARKLFVIDTDGSNLTEIPLPELADGSGTVHVYDIAINQDGSRFYFITPWYHGKIFRVDIAANPISAQVTEVANLYALHGDANNSMIKTTARGDWVYYTNWVYQEGTGDLLRIAHDGGSPQVVVDDTAVPVDGGGTGWQVRGFDISADGEEILFYLMGYHDAEGTRHNWWSGWFTLSELGFTQLTPTTNRGLGSGVISGYGNKVMITEDTNDGVYISSNLDGSDRNEFEARGYNFAGAALTFDGSRMFYADHLAANGRIVSTNGKTGFPISYDHNFIQAKAFTQISDLGTIVSFVSQIDSRNVRLYAGELNSAHWTSSAPVIESIRFEPGFVLLSDPESTVKMKAQITGGVGTVQQAYADNLIDGRFKTVCAASDAIAPFGVCHWPEDDGEAPDDQANDDVYTALAYRNPAYLDSPIRAVTVRISAMDAAGNLRVADDVLTLAEFTGIPADIDANGAADALSDGIMLIRALRGIEGESLTDGARATNAQRTDQEIVDFVNSNRSLFDMDGNGIIDATTDGNLMIRHLFGFRGNPLISGVLGSGATRTTAEAIDAYAHSLLETASSDPIYYAPTGVPQVPYVFTRSHGDILAGVFDTDSGELTGIDWFFPTDDKIHIQLSDQGMPTEIAINDTVILIGNVRKDEQLADLMVIRADGQTTRVSDISFDMSLLDRGSEVATSAKSFGPVSASGGLSAWENVSVVGSTVIDTASFVSCLVVIGAAGITGNIPGVLVIASACGGTAAKVVTRTFQESSPKVADTANAFGVGTSLGAIAACVTIPAGETPFEKTQRLLACLEGYGLVIKTFADGSLGLFNQDETAIARLILQGRGGDIQVSLVWDTAEDLDLMVKSPDPADGTVDKDNVRVPSCGALDSGDVSAWGPENVSWPTGFAPPGIYSLDIYNNGSTPANYILSVFINGSMYHNIRSAVEAGQTLAGPAFSHAGNSSTSRPSCGMSLRLIATKNSMSENNGSILVALERTGDVSAEVTVSLSISDTSESDTPEASVVPSTRIFRAGESHTDLLITSIDDSIDDGDQIVTIHATAPGYEPVSAPFTVIDDDEPATGVGYTKYNALGALPESATQWTCVKDNATGLFWEAKTHTSLGQYTDDYATFTWYSDQGVGYKDSYDSCYGGRWGCDTQSYVERVNDSDWPYPPCNKSNWRMPTIEELQGLVDNDSHPRINGLYFPYVGGHYWSGTLSTDANDPNSALYLEFTYGSSQAADYVERKRVLLVHDPE